MLVKHLYYHVPPWYCPIPGGDMIVKYFHYHVGSYVSKNTRGGDTIRLLIKLIVMNNTRGDMLMKPYIVFFLTFD